MRSIPFIYPYPYYVRRHVFYNTINELITFCCLHYKYTIAVHDISILLWTMYCFNIMHAYIYSTLLFLTKYLLKSLLHSFVRNSNVICMHCMRQHWCFGSYWHFTCTYINNASTRSIAFVRFWVISN